MNTLRFWRALRCLILFTAEDAKVAKKFKTFSFYYNKQIGLSINQINFAFMKTLNISLIATIGLMIIVSGCINSEDIEQKQNLTQNITKPLPISTITADVGTGHAILSHMGGDEIAMGDLTIIIEQGDIYSIYEKLGQADNKFAKGDILDLTPDKVYLNDNIIDAKISTNTSGITGNETSITLLSNGNKFAKIVSRYEFFE